MPGDTLSTIAQKYKVSVRELMDLNRIYDADKLKAGQKIILPKYINTKRIEDSGKKHIVKEGENISVIASIYKVNVEDIASLNKVTNPSLISIGEVLKLPKGSFIPITKKEIDSFSYHNVKSGETLGMISKKYNISLAELIKINDLNQPNYINPGDRIYLKPGSAQKKSGKENTKRDFLDRKSLTRSPNSDGSDWRPYGKLKVNWSNWKIIDNSYVAPALNQNGKPLFIAVNCNSTKINSTGRNNAWKEWFSPNNDFEFDLIDDLCGN